MHKRTLYGEVSTAKPQKNQLSLFEELFPEEIDNYKFQQVGNRSKEKSVPRLRLPNVDEIDRLYQDGPTEGRTQHDGMSIEAFMERDSLRQGNLAVLIIRRASKSLVQSDFRRIAPKGQHIHDWKGPGDILKVIPARNLSTLQQLGYYFIVFPNPAYARAYQARAIAFHRIARAHTPTSLKSPIMPSQGISLEGVDARDIVQNYSLCPPSQKISLRVLFPPYSPNMKLLLSQHGYSQIISPDDKTGRAVLLWVHGYQPKSASISNMINRDGQDRGLAWALALGENSVEKVECPISPMEDPENPGSRDDADSPRTRSVYPRWIISFTDENEARRFTRSWHRRPFPLRGERVAVGEPHPLVHAEVIW
ncbi:hypothetical protein MMC07_009565 [Pseudocyphellaria aurata]|nr:hypothetical protein [Pseudocyphellaria aurata]